MLMFIVLFIILTSPCWGAFAHDLWLLHKNTGKLNWDELIFSDVGWLWVTYAEKSYNKAIKTWDAELWDKYIDPILNTDAIIVGGAVSLLLLFIVLPFHLKGLKDNDGVSALDNDDGFSFSSVRRNMDKGQL